MDVRAFKELPILGILRGVGIRTATPLVETMVEAGLKTVEITMNTDAASTLIAHVVRAAAGRLTVGAGTVLTLNDLRAALDAGASFVVMPCVRKDVLQYCSERSIPVFPGALTPTEIYEAWTAGATMVKIFPANVFGPGYLKDVKGPFDRLELLACGGVNAGNIRAFFENGASAVAFGASIFTHRWIEEGAYDRIGQEIRRLIDAYLRSDP